MKNQPPGPREGRNLEPTRDRDEDAPANREPGVARHPNASKPRRDIEQRADREEQDAEDGAHLYGERAVDGRPHERRYLEGDKRKTD